MNHGPAAFLLGFLCAWAAAGLYMAGILPAVRGFRLDEDGTSIQCAWCAPSGVFGHYAGLLLWAGRKLVFLDVACVDQQDPLRKTEGLVSMGALLKSSKRMLALVDVSFTCQSAEPVHVGLAGHHVPDGATKPLQCHIIQQVLILRQHNHNPYDGVRIGEASNPGPPRGGGSGATDRKRNELAIPNLGRVLALLQELLALLGGNGDRIAQLASLIKGLDGGDSDSKGDTSEEPPAPTRRVTIADPPEEAWQEVHGRAQKGGQRQRTGCYSDTTRCSRKCCGPYCSGPP